MLQSLGSDLLYSFRVHARTPGATAATVAALALGIGPNLAIFTLFNALLLQPLAVEQPGELVVVSRRSPGGLETDFPYPAFEALRDGAQSLDGLAAWSPAVLVVRTDDIVEQLNTEIISPEYFPTLGIRLFRGADSIARSSPAPGAVISYTYWAARFGRADSVIGREMVIDGTPIPIIGVAPPGFSGIRIGTSAAAWLPSSIAPLLQRRPDVLLSHTLWWANMIGRLRPNVSELQARNELSGLFQAYRRHAAGARVTPQRDREIQAETIELQPGARGVSRLRETRGRLMFWVSLVGFVMLLLVCSNLASVTIARLEQRRDEFAIRLSLGASTARLYRHILTECATLVIASVLVGCALWYWMTPVFGRLFFGLAVQLDLTANWRLAAFAVLIALAASLFLASLGIRWAANKDLATVLRAAGAGARVDGGPRRIALNRWVLLAQAALTVVLVLEAGALTRSFLRISRQSLGFDAHDLLIVQLDTSQAGIAGPAFVSFQRELLDRVAGLPGTVSATFSRTVPLDTAQNLFDRIKLERGGNSCEVGGVDLQLVEERYFATMGIPALAGNTRIAVPADRLAPSGNALPGTPGPPLPVVINETLARRCTDRVDALGARVLAGGTVMEVAGVVRDAKYHGLREEAIPVMYAPYLGWHGDPWGPMAVLIRTAAPAEQASEHVREALRELGRYVFVRETKTMQLQVEQVLLPDRVLAEATGIAMAVALLLVGLGTYATVTLIVNHRLRACAVRMALGAHFRHVAWQCCRSLLVWTLIGVGAGYVLSLPLKALTASLLFGARDDGAITVGLSAAVVVIAALMGAGMPLTRLRNPNLALLLRGE